MSNVSQHLLSGIVSRTYIRREDRSITFFLLGAISGLASSILLQPCTSASSRIARLAPLTTPLVDLVKTRLQQGDSRLSKKSVLLVFVRPNLTLIFVQARWHYSLHHASHRFFLWCARSLAWHIRNVNAVHSHPFLPFSRLTT